jgi:hypothetical protein
MSQVRNGHDPGVEAVSRLCASKGEKSGERVMGVQQEDRQKTIQEKIAEEGLVQERIDQSGNKWRKIYFGGGQHCRNWLEQFKEFREVQVEEVDPRGFKCFEEGGEKLYRVWLKMDQTRLDDLF